MIWVDHPEEGGGMIAGWELVVGYLTAWAARKARRAGERLDDDVDLVIDTELDKFHDLIARKLGTDPSLERLELEAAAGQEVSTRTRRRVEDALAEAAETDHEFAVKLDASLAELRQAGVTPVMTVSGERSATIIGDVEVKAEGGVAVGAAGTVNVGGPAADPPKPGRPSG
jgi:hypothetical protein